MVYKTLLCSRDISTQFIPTRTPLDGIFDAIATKYNGGNWIQARAKSPISIVNGLSACSVPFYEDIEYAGAHAFSQMPRSPDYAKYATVITPNAFDKSIPKEPIPKEEWTKEQHKRYLEKGTIPLANGDKNCLEWGNSEKGGQAVLNHYDTYFAKTVRFIAVTHDLPEFLALLNNIDAIGKRHHCGYGVLSDSWSYAILPDDVSPFVDVDGVPLRPIPVGTKGIKVAKHIPTARAGYQPAYWDPENRRTCYMPPLDLVSHNEYQLAKRLGVA